MMERHGNVLHLWDVLTGLDGKRHHHTCPHVLDTKSEFSLWNPDTGYAFHLCPGCPGPEPTRNPRFARLHVALWQQIRESFGKHARVNTKGQPSDPDQERP